MGRAEELLRQVWQRPDDDQLRLVLADALIEAGDPRGRFIQLQFQPELDHVLEAMRLLQRHGLQWLGALRSAVLPVAYERGFLASCETVDDDSWPDVTGCDEWSTVHTIHLHVTDADFLLHPAMRSLRRVWGVEPSTLRQLADRAARL